MILPSAETLSTAEVYGEADRLGLPRASLDGIRERLLSTLPRPDDSLLRNDLEPAAVSLCPPIVSALEAARRAGADQAMVCGSGPTVIGVYWGADAARRAREAAGALTPQFPGALPATPISS